MSPDVPAEINPEETIHKFGKVDFTDIVLVARGHEFHCHKIMLATRSEYFAGLFYSDFIEKNQDRIEIDVDPKPLNGILEILYLGHSKDIEELMDYKVVDRLGIDNIELNKRLWNVVKDVFVLADRVLIKDVVFASIEYTFMRNHGKCTKDFLPGGCYQCAAKLITAIQHKMIKYKEMSVSSITAVETVLQRFGDIHLDISASDMAYLLNRPDTRTNAPAQNVPAQNAPVQNALVPITPAKMCTIL